MAVSRENGNFPQIAMDVFGGRVRLGVEAQKVEMGAPISKAASFHTRTNNFLLFPPQRSALHSMRATLAQVEGGGRNSRFPKSAGNLDLELSL